jgi:hypothetical protein
MAAEHGWAGDDVIAGLHVGDLVTDGFDDAGSLVPEECRSLWQTPVAAVRTRTS